MLQFFCRFAFLSTFPLFISARVTFRPFKVIQGHRFRYQLKGRICDFLLIRHSNLGPIVHHVGDIAGFLWSWVRLSDPTPIPVIMGCSRIIPLHQIAHMLGSMWAGALSIGATTTETGPPQLLDPWDHQWVGPIQLLTTDINVSDAISKFTWPNTTN